MDANSSAETSNSLSLRVNAVVSIIEWVGVSLTCFYVRQCRILRMGILQQVFTHKNSDSSDRDGAPDVLASIRHNFPWLLHVFANRG